MLVNYGPIGLIQKVLQQDDLAIFIYMGDAFIVSLMLQWLNNRVLNVKYFNRNMKQTQDTIYVNYIYMTWGTKQLSKDHFEFLN